MIYTNVYDLVCSIVKADPQTTISSYSLQWSQGGEISTHSSALAANTDESRDITQAIFDCLSSHFFSFRAPGTVDFTFAHFRFDDQGLTTQATWEIARPSEFEETTFSFKDQQDVWGTKIQVIGGSNFETIRASLNATGEVKFELVLDEKGWVKNNVAFSLVEEAPEMIEPGVLALINDNLPAINNAIRTQLMNFAKEAAADFTTADTSNFSLEWSSEGSLIYPNEEFGEDITNTPLNAIATEHMKAEHCKRIFDFPCNCFFEVT